MSAKRRTTAWALSGLCVLVIVYASLYPFEDWRNQDIAPWFFVGAPWSAYNTWFDIYSNLLGYVPLGFWWCLAAMRSQWTRAGSGVFAVVCACVLSFAMECLQTYLPTRVPSQLDWLLNTSGALLGAVLALVLEKRGWLYRWSQFRSQWLMPDASGSLVLLVLWPLALLYPVTVPFGLGHVFERLEKILQDTFPAAANHMVQISEAWFLTMTPALEMLCVTLGVWVPGLLVLSVCQRFSQRLAGVWLVMVCAVLANGLSATLTYGPERAWHWLSPQVWGGMGGGVLLSLAVIKWQEHRLLWMLCLTQSLLLLLLNITPASTYFAQTMQTWEQGRFIRFHGLTAWFSAWWPWCLLAWACWRMVRIRAFLHRA